MIRRVSSTTSRARLAGGGRKSRRLRSIIGRMREIVLGAAQHDRGHHPGVGAQRDARRAEGNERGTAEEVDVDAEFCDRARRMRHREHLAAPQTRETPPGRRVRGRSRSCRAWRGSPARGRSSAGSGRFGDRVHPVAVQRPARRRRYPSCRSAIVAMMMPRPELRRLVQFVPLVEAQSPRTSSRVSGKWMKSITYLPKLRNTCHRTESNVARRRCLQDVRQVGVQRLAVHAERSPVAE